jgi:hypothetical protein
LDDLLDHSEEDEELLIEISRYQINCNKKIALNGQL